MEYRAFGRTGVQVSALCLGCMNWGDSNSGTREDDSIRIMHQAIDADINFFDADDVYGRGVSETITGKALADAGRRNTVFVATKVYNRMDNTDPKKPAGISTLYLSPAVTSATTTVRILDLTLAGFRKGIGCVANDGRDHF